ncbi:MAG: flagellar biosynthetic protein FliO [Ruminococcus sp.]|nr:flagellar biosynthetic protein FliO [Ruminococcus sp.]MBR1752129.1 flagellar biosynthetic protein FliO [Ruminococcus sp.]
MIKSVFSLIFGLILFVGILYLAYISTKLIGKRYSLSGKGGRNLKILETVSVGREMSIAIARAGEKIFLIGVTPDRISLLSELSEDDLLVGYTDNLPQSDGSGSGNMTFAQALKLNINEKLGRSSVNTAKKDVLEDGSDNE